ncbi:MAG: cation diffusion facilitator family transporter [Eubacteriales bacterium]
MQKKQRDPGISIVLFAVILNGALFLIKSVAGIGAHSTALQADAVNSIGDTMSSLAIYFGLRYASKPRDDDHHYGHGKMEALISLFVGIFILVSSGFLWSSIINALKSKALLETSVWALVVALIAILTKFYMYKRTLRVGKSINSLAVQTNAMDNRNDVFATSATAFAIILTMVYSKTQIGVLKYAEPFAAGIMSVFIIKTGIEIITASAKVLLDTAPNDEVMDTLKSIAGDLDGVKKLNWLKCRTVGRGIWVDLAIEVEANLTVEQGHEIADSVKDAIYESVENVAEVLVHVNPVSSSYPSHPDN